MTCPNTRTKLLILLFFKNLNAMKSLMFTILSITFLLAFSFEPNIVIGSKMKSLKTNESVNHKQDQASNTKCLLTAVYVTPIVSFTDCDIDCYAKYCNTLYIYMSPNIELLNRTFLYLHTARLLNLRRIQICVNPSLF